MRDDPILMTGAMVRAAMRPVNPKTQTRRLLYVPTKRIASSCFDRRYPPPVWDSFDAVPTLSKWRTRQAGDRLYVREAIRLVPDQEPDDGTGRVLSMYDADKALTVADAWPWKRSFLPAMHCPRGLVRLRLEHIADARIERLQDISEADALAEGISADWAERPIKTFQRPPLSFQTDAHGNDVLTSLSASFLNNVCSPVEAYRVLWESINGAGSWDANPWVVVLTFKRIYKPGELDDANAAAYHGGEGDPD